MTAYASPVDTEVHGEYSIRRRDGDPRPLYRFAGRVRDDGSTPFTPDPGRYHLYSGWFCPWAQRSVLAVELTGLTGAVSVSYVDNARDGRGWAFREAKGADPVNGFTLLREAYEATEPGFDGHISVPTLWDREAGRIVSNDYGLLDIDLSTRFGAHARKGIEGEGAEGEGVELYPDHLRYEVDALDRWLGPAVNKGAGAALGTGPDAKAAARALAEAFQELDERLGRNTYMLGDRLTLADVRLWVTLIRHDAAAARAEAADALPDAARRAGVGRLSAHPALWSYTRELFQLPAFDRTTDPASIGATPEVVAGWRRPGDRKPRIEQTTTEQNGGQDS